MAHHVHCHIHYGEKTADRPTFGSERETDDAGTSEGARKAAATRKAHAQRALMGVGVAPSHKTKYHEGGAYHQEQTSLYPHEMKARMEVKGFKQTAHEHGVTARAGGNARTGHPGRVTGGGFHSTYEHSSGVTAHHDVPGMGTRGTLTYHVKTPSEHKVLSPEEFKAGAHLREPRTPRGMGKNRRPMAGE